MVHCGTAVKVVFLTEDIDTALASKCSRRCRKIACRTSRESLFFGVIPTTSARVILFQRRAESIAIVLLPPSVRSRDIDDIVADEILVPTSYVHRSGKISPPNSFSASMLIFGETFMTLFREPSLYELLNDPIVHLVMRADGVTKDDILDLYDHHDEIDADTPPAFICSGLLRTVSRPEA
jgi:hypothetical protein